MDVKAEADPKFHIYLCFGQSNMEGNYPASAEDKTYVDPRFQTLATTDFTTPCREMGNWYTAYPPIISDKITIGPLDFFGRAMVAALPADYRVGVVPVAIGSADIRAFMSELVEEYVETNPYYFARYGNDPYRRLVDMAKEAQKYGVIKGILMHQGEKNCGAEEWPEWVKTVYERLLAELDLDAAEVPLLAGEVVNVTEEGKCSEHNKIIAQLPTLIPTAHVISSVGCPCSSDHLHFNAMGYAILGKRYALKMLELLGFDAQKDASYQLLHESHRTFYKATRIDVPTDLNIAPCHSDTITVTAYFEDGHQENFMPEAVVTTLGSGLTVNDSILTAVTDERALVTFSYRDFMGETFTSSFHVNPTGPISGFITDIKNYILGRPSKTFDMQAADVNADKIINVADIVHFINKN